MKTKKERVKFITLGCFKNTVDSEKLIKQLEANDIQVDTSDAKKAFDTLIINTCGFIGDAKKQSIDTILKGVEAKRRGRFKKLLVIGCLSQRYKEDLEKEIPEVDAFYGTEQYKEVLTFLNHSYRDDLIGDRVLTTPKHYAYLKISEGCNKTCSYCVIPIIRGKHKSRSIESLVDEAKSLANQGVKELILIAQDLTYYGYDLYFQYKLPELLRELCKIEGIEWLRLHYVYPANLTDELLELISTEPKICKYLDIPFQHISDKMLTLMRRGHKKADIYAMIQRLRERVPELALRTTFVAGHPGEKDEDFEEVVQFIQDVKFERLGVFTYSNEEDSYAYENYKDDVPPRIKKQRADLLMEKQQDISLKLNEEKIGKIFKVLIDRVEGDSFVGRSQYDSPEVDNEVWIENPNPNIKVGTFYNVMINSATEFDVTGEII